MQYLIRYAEIGREPHPQKSKLEKDILEEIRTLLPGVKIGQETGRIFIETEKDVTKTLKTIHGISSFSPCRKCLLDKLDEEFLDFSKNIIKGKKSFGVKVKRVGSHPFTSQEKAAQLGALILDLYPGLKVDLKTPDEMLLVEIREDSCYLFNQIIHSIDQESPLIPGTVQEPRFIVDDMLGKLAVRLRMLGFDATFYHDSADSFLLRKSREEGRVLLTRDLELSKIKNANALFIESKLLKYQIQQVIGHFGLKIILQNMFSRCSVCNAPLKNISREEAKSHVPPMVYKIFNEFAYCPKCEKYYWKGTHYEKMIEELQDFI